MPARRVGSVGCRRGRPYHSAGYRNSPWGGGEREPCRLAVRGQERRSRLLLGLRPFAACMLSTRFGYGRPAFLADRLARAFCAGEREVWRAFLGAAFFQGAFRFADLVDLGIRESKAGRGGGQ